MALALKYPAKVDMPFNKENKRNNYKASLSSSNLDIFSKMFVKLQVEQLFNSIDKFEGFPFNLYKEIRFPFVKSSTGFPYAYINITSNRVDIAMETVFRGL